MSTEYTKPSHLPEHPSDGIGTLVIDISEPTSLAFSQEWSTHQYIRLPRLHRAGPSTSLDKSAIGGYEIMG